MFFTKKDREKFDFELDATRERFEALEKWCDNQQAAIDDLLVRFEELYKHLKIHRAYVNETPARHELRDGENCNTFTMSTTGFWPFTAVTTALPPVIKPAKKRRKRKKA